MKLSQFKFRLPEELIALEPTYHRDECRLMVAHRKSGKIEMTKKDIVRHKLVTRIVQAYEEADRNSRGEK